MSVDMPDKLGDWEVVMKSERDCKYRVAIVREWISSSADDLPPSPMLAWSGWHAVSAVGTPEDTRQHVESEAYSCAWAAAEKAEWAKLQFAPLKSKGNAREGMAVRTKGEI